MSDNISLFQRCNIFSSFTDGELERMLSYCSDVQLAVDDVLFTEDDRSDAMYFVVGGHISIERFQDGQHEHVAQFISDEYFGENGLFLNQKRGVRAVASTKAQLLRLPAPNVTLQSIIAEHHNLANKFLTGLISHTAQRIRDMNNLIRTNSAWVSELRHQLMIDKLMAIHNMRSYREEYLSKIQHSNKCVMVMLKPTNFKHFNDTYGHQVGDAILHYYGSVLNQAVEGVGVAFRYLGNQVALLFLDDNVKHATATIEKFYQLFNGNSLQRFGVTGSEQMAFCHISLEYPRQCSEVGRYIDAAHEVLMEVFDRE